MPIAQSKVVVEERVESIDMVPLSDCTTLSSPLKSLDVES
jgi:hypothetical protein